VRARKRLSFSLDMHAAQFQAEVFAIYAYAKRRDYTSEHIYICSDTNQL
jgi:hypothetical protein